jgi:hypothetical protein
MVCWGWGVDGLAGYSQLSAAAHSCMSSGGLILGTFAQGVGTNIGHLRTRGGG